MSPMMAGFSAARGDLVFTMDQKGHAALVSLPEMRGQAEELASPHNIVFQFFPLLPGGAVDPGESWTDTIHFEAEIGQGDTDYTSVMTYTLQGDTIVDGVSLLHFSVAGTADVFANGVNEGMEISQAFSGDIEGSLFWDAARGVYYGGTISQDMTGILEVPAAGMPPMPLTITGTSHVRLQGG